SLSWTVQLAPHMLETCSEPSLPAVTPLSRTRRVLCTTLTLLVNVPGDGLLLEMLMPLPQAQQAVDAVFQRRPSMSSMTLSCTEKRAASLDMSPQPEI